MAGSRNGRCQSECSAPALCLVTLLGGVVDIGLVSATPIATVSRRLRTLHPAPSPLVHLALIRALCIPGVQGCSTPRYYTLHTVPFRTRYAGRRQIYDSPLESQLLLVHDGATKQLLSTQVCVAGTWSGERLVCIRALASATPRPCRSAQERAAINTPTSQQTSSNTLPALPTTPGRRPRGCVAPQG